MQWCEGDASVVRNRIKYLLVDSKPRHVLLNIFSQGFCILWKKDNGEE